jgi:soluble lytic murein transglycosylase-like protein
MSQHGKALAILTLGIAIAVSGLAVTRQVVAAIEEADAGRLHQSILAYVAEKNPRAPVRVFQGFPPVLVAEAQRSNLDHCLALAQAEVESHFRHDAVGAAGEIGIFQILPSTAAIFESQLGPFRRPVIDRGRRDLGDLANPVVSTKFAMAYLRDIMQRRPTIREALTEYNAGPRGGQLHYYRLVMGTYVEILERAELRCRFREVPRPPLLLTLLTRV